MDSLLVYRLRFQLWNLRSKMGWLNTKKYSDYEYEPEEDEAAAAEFDRELQAYLDAEPKLDPRRTMMFFARKGENQCNELRKKRFQTRILLAYYWAKEHGINHFIVDPTSPFGLLALETLLELRTLAENFHIYIFQSIPPSKRKSYRLLPETEIEYMILLSQTDYRYRVSWGHTLRSIMEKAGTLCSERRVWFSKRIPDYLREVWRNL